MPEETAPPEAKTEPAASGVSALSLQTDRSGNVGSSQEAAQSPRHLLPDSSPLSKLPMQLDVTIPVPSFRVEDLLALERGEVVETLWSPSEDVPVWCGGSQLVWSEFEVIDQRLAVRVTRLG